MAQHIGLNVVEGVSNGLTPFNEASISNIGVLMERERGIPNKVIFTDSLQVDRIRFGGIQSNHYGAFITRHIFNNSGQFGAIIYGCRMYAGSAAADTAHGILTDGTTDPTLTLLNTQAADSNHGQIDKHTPANVSIGDTFRISCGGEIVSYTATAGTAANVIAGLIAAITAYRAAHAQSNWATKIASFTNQSTYLQTTTVDNTPMTFVDSTQSGGTIMTFYAGQEGQKDPGTWANTLNSGKDGLVVKAYPKNHPNGILNEYLVEVYYNGSLVEVYQAADWATMIDKINLSSMFIMAVPNNLLLTLTGDALADIQTVTFDGGVYTEYVSDAARVTAFKPSYDGGGVASGAALFDGQDIQILIQTEVVTETANELSELAASLRDYCGNRGDVYHVFSHPMNASDSMIGQFATALQESLPSFAGGYHLWVKTSNENGLQVWTPGIGCIIGAGFVRTREMGRGFAWIPPAGTDSNLKDCSDITPNPLSREKVDLFVRSRSTNVVQFQKGYGFMVMSSRTYSTNPLFHSAHVRLMTNWLTKTLSNNLLWSVQKPNTVTLRKDIVSAIIAFGRGIYANGGLETTIPFAEAWKVICDKTNNPTYQDRKLLNVTIEWIPVECTEAVVINLNRNDGMLIVKSLES